MDEAHSASKRVWWWHLLSTVNSILIIGVLLYVSWPRLSDAGVLAESGFYLVDEKGSVLGQLANVQGTATLTSTAGTIFDLNTRSLQVRRILIGNDVSISVESEGVLNVEFGSDRRTMQIDLAAIETALHKPRDGIDY